MTVEPQENIIDRELADLFRTKYGAFAVSSNARAIPDARDGLALLRAARRGLLQEADRPEARRLGHRGSARVFSGRGHPVV